MGLGKRQNFSGLPVTENLVEMKGFLMEEKGVATMVPNWEFRQSRSQSLPFNSHPVVLNQMHGNWVAVSRF